MIIRRRHTSNFANISNALRDDVRLQADEVGILYYLLTQPQDWEVRLPQLRKRWDIGPDRMKRIYWNWMRTGWCRAEKVRLKETGHFYINFEIWPEPGPGMTDAEIRQALSVGSTESEPDDAPDQTPEPGGSEPGVDGQGVETGGVAHIESTKTDSQNTDSTNAPAALWRDLRASWPASDIKSLPLCEQLFAALSREERQKAVEGVSQYLANTRAKNHKLCDLGKYLKEKRFVEIQPITVGFEVLPNSPEAFRWTEYWATTGKSFTLRDAESKWKLGRPAFTPRQWPPPLPDAKKAG